jgi:hypothetical protein
MFFTTQNLLPVFRVLSESLQVPSATRIVASKLTDAVDKNELMATGQFNSLDEMFQQEQQIYSLVVMYSPSEKLTHIHFPPLAITNGQADVLLLQSFATSVAQAIHAATPLQPEMLHIPRPFVLGAFLTNPADCDTSMTYLYSANLDFRSAVNALCGVLMSVPSDASSILYTADDVEFNAEQVRRIRAQK